ncbi:MAG: arylesterase [Rhodospirillaceae bacterium]|nr:arylesterase [Rhodospirillaceae bacterium]MBT6085530.1 arylesterase [Rhodospirillaceae bacterium]MBT6884154.1 arylesterase [Rhodospirillaceae bacterium]MBT7511812.1 arylesterase [Rhodospirillaceae bacterium]
MRASRGYGLYVVLVNVWLAIGQPIWAADPPVILALGDSLTAGYGLAQPDSFTVQLEAALAKAGTVAKIKNAGVSGDTSAGGRARLAWALAEKPDAVMIELGANDGLRGLNPKRTEANLDAIIAMAKAQGLPVLLTGMRAPPNLGVEYCEEFNSLFARLARKHEVLFYPFFLEGVAALPTLNQADGIHPNGQGVAEIVRRLAPIVEKLITQVGRK